MDVPNFLKVNLKDASTSGENFLSLVAISKKAILGIVSMFVLKMVVNNTLMIMFSHATNGVA